MRQLLLSTLLAVAILPASGQDFGGSGKVQSPDGAARIAANDALAAHDYPRAEKLLLPLAAKTPGDARIQYDLGSCQDALDQGSAAEASYRAAIADDAKFLEPRAALGLLLARSGRMDDARTELIGAASLETGDKPLRARVLRALARIDEKSRPQVARDELLAALQISPETAEDTLLAAELAETAGNGAPAAEATYRKLLATTPDDPSAAASLAHLLVQGKSYDEADKLLTHALAAHPGDEALTIQLAAAYNAEGKRAEALPLVEALHARSPQEASVTRLLAELYYDSDQDAKAEPLLRSLLLGHPRDGEIAELDASTLVRLKRYDEVTQVLTPVVGDPGNFPDQESWGRAIFDLAFAASEQNQPATVLRLLSLRAKTISPTPAILFLTAISQDKLHQAKAAAETYKAFLSASNGALPDEEFEARHRLIALQHAR